MLRKASKAEEVVHGIRGLGGWVQFQAAIMESQSISG